MQDKYKVFYVYMVCIRLLTCYECDIVSYLPKIMFAAYVLYIKNNNTQILDYIKRWQQNRNGAKLR